jgi:lactate permease
MQFILALTPIALILYLMVGYRWGAARAGAAGYLCAILIAILCFGANLELLAYAHTKAFFLALDVLIIIWAAFLLYRVADEAGAIHIIGTALPHLTPDRGMQALIIGWVFASFLQGVGGFGVPVAVIAPILVGLGFPPLSGVIIPSIGHGWAVTFGSMGSSFNALLAATGLPEHLLTGASAFYLGCACIMTGYLVTHAADGWAAIRRLWFQTLLLGMVMAITQFIVVTSGAWNIGSFIAGLFGLIVAFPLAIQTRTKLDNDTEPLNFKALWIAISGYAILIVLTLCFQLITPLKNWFGNFYFQLPFPEISTNLGYSTPAGTGRKLYTFGHTGMIIFYASIIAYIVYHNAGLYKPGAAARIISGTIQKVLSSSISIAIMVTMAVVMQHAGMTEIIARGLAEGVGILFPFVSPWIGALGAFMTGSNTNSNVVFGALQMRTAELLNYAIPIILAAQTSGAALASVMAPTKVVVGASTAGMSGREGDVMRKLLVYVGLLLLLISFLTMVSILIGNII